MSLHTILKRVFLINQLKNLPIFLKQVVVDNTATKFHDFNSPHTTYLTKALVIFKPYTGKVVIFIEKLYAHTEKIERNSF